MALSLHSPEHLRLEQQIPETPAQDPTGAAVILGKPPHKLTLGASSLSLRVSLCPSPLLTLASFPHSHLPRGQEDHNPFC